MEFMLIPMLLASPGHQQPYYWLCKIYVGRSVSSTRKDFNYLCRFSMKSWFNSSTPGPNGRHFADDRFRCIFVNKKFCILMKRSLNFVPKYPIDNNPALVYIMAWRWTGDKPLFEPILIKSLTYICGTRRDELICKSIFRQNKNLICWKGKFVPPLKPHSLQMAIWRCFTLPFSALWATVTKYISIYISLHITLAWHDSRFRFFLIWFCPEGSKTVLALFHIWQSCKITAHFFKNEIVFLFSCLDNIVIPSDLFEISIMFFKPTQESLRNIQ